MSTDPIETKIPEPVNTWDMDQERLRIAVAALEDIRKFASEASAGYGHEPGTDVAVILAKAQTSINRMSEVIA